MKALLSARRWELLHGRFLRSILITIVTVFLLACAAHPTVSDHTLEKGESFYGYTLSFENIFPIFYYRYGISPVSDVGFRVGVPIYGSGIDYSRVLYRKGNKRDVLNVGWSLTPNSNFDFTYYKFSHGKKDPRSSRYWGIRGMYIPNGVAGNQSVRVGALFGVYRKGKIGYEVGYFHDIASMPITEIFNTNFDPADTSQQWGDRFVDYPHVSDAGLPTEHSRLTGLSVRLSISLSGKKEEEPPPPSLEE